MGPYIYIYIYIYIHVYNVSPKKGTTMETIGKVTPSLHKGSVKQLMCTSSFFFGLSLLPPPMCLVPAPGSPFLNL